MSSIKSKSIWDNFYPSFTSLNMRLKRGAIGNTFGEQIGNLMGTSWELKGNMLGTKEKRKKCFLHPPTASTQNLKEKKSRHFECMLSLPIGCIKFLFFQNCSSPFLAWANTPIINWGTYLFNTLILCSHIDKVKRKKQQTIFF